MATELASPPAATPVPIPESANSPSADIEESSALVATKADASGEDQAIEPARKTKIIRRKRRPARPQVDPATIKSEQPAQSGTIFNIWYGKWAHGDTEDRYLSQTHAKGRCVVATDSGWTRADKVQGSYFCLFFARGLCPNGHECDYLHRLPGIHDHFNPNIDCFGRDKHSDYRDDMGGVGSFMRQNRTLYVGRIHVTDDIEEIVARHFAEWGDVERTRVLTGRGVAFVTYANEANASFAKEAMAHQSLDNEEILNVRWATVDPNPASAKREARRVEEQAAEAVRRALPEEFVRELEGRMPDAKKRRREEGNHGLEGYEPPDEIWYARSKAIEGQNGGDTKFIEGGNVDDAQEMTPGSAQPFTAFEDAASQGNSILQASTLAAMKGFTAQRSAAAAPAKPAAKGGALVGYGSEDDSD